MKIKYAIMGSDKNPLYYDFWPIVSKTWREVFGIVPVLGLVCNEDSDFIETSDGIIKKFKNIENINTGLQTQIVRFYLSSIMNDVCITSDIDMIPLSKKYFINLIKGFDQEKLYVMTADNPECLQNKEYQMCYNVGTPTIFSEVLDIEKSWLNFANKLNDLNQGWTTDQKYLYSMVQKHKDKVVLMNRGFNWNGGYANHRIDRAFWSYDPNGVKNGNYIDSHLLRPYSKHKSEIDHLVGLLY